MNHYILTRSAYGDTDANSRRLALTLGITVPSMAAQTEKRWEWVVLLDPADPYLAEREAAFRSVAPLRIVWWHGGGSMYDADWSGALDRSEPTLMTRLDDDDALTPDALARIRTAAQAANAPGRMVWMLPEGFRVYQGRYAAVRHESNMFATLQVPPGDPATVYDYGHMKARRFAEVRMVDDAPAWLFVRHPDTRSRSRHVTHPIDVELRARFPIEWSLVG